MKALGPEHLPLQEELQSILHRLPPVNQQIAIELLAVRHAFRMANKRDAMFVADSMHKHIRQLLEQAFGSTP